jgi:hypothetical protein
MSTGELERLERVERLIGAGLHEVDQVAIDVRRGRAKLAPHVTKRRQAVRRRTVIALTAAVIVAAVAAPLVIADLRDHEGALPVGPSPGVTLSPSGLPVGILRGRVERTQPGATSTITVVVRADGTGTWNAGTVGDSEGTSVRDYPVQFVPDGPGRAIMRQDAAGCGVTDVLTLTFTVRGRTVVIEDSGVIGCLVSQGLARDLAGSTLRVRPLP